MSTTKKKSPSLKTGGVKRIRIPEEASLVDLRGTLEHPLHAVINSKEEGGYILAEVPDDGYYHGTSNALKGREYWIHQWAGEHGPDFTPAEMSNKRGRKIKGEIEKRQCGSALLWIEAFHYKPENTGQTGFLVSGKCKPAITSVTWHRYQNNNKGPEIGDKEEVYFGDLLQLHIKTEGLNGDMLEVGFHEDENGTIIDKTQGRTYGGLLIVNVPIKTVWRSKLFNWLEKLGGDELVINVIINSSSRDNAVKFYGKPLKITNQISKRVVSKEKPVPVTIGKVAFDPQQYEPCKYTAIVIKTKDREYPFFEEGKTPAGQMQPFEVVAGSAKNKKEVTIELKDYKTERCILSDNAHKKQEAYITSFDFGEDNQKNTEVLKIEGDKLKYNLTSSLSEYNILPLNYIWPKRKKLAHIYKFNFQTCRYTKDLIAHAYPDIVWTLEFKWNHDAPFAYGYSKGLPEHSIDKKKAISASIDGEWAKQGEMAQSFNYSLKAKWDDGDAIELSDKFLEKIRKTLGLFVKIKTMVEDITDELKGHAPFTFEISSPAIALAAKWKLKELNSKTTEHLHQVATLVTIGASAKPLVGATFTLDLIALAAELGSPAISKILTFIRTKAEKTIKITFEVRLKGEINIEGKVEINTLLPEETTGELKVTGDVGVEIELSAKGGGETAIAGFEAAAELEAGITGKTSVTGGMEGGADKNGIYCMPVASFNGIIATFVLKGSIKFGTVKKTFDKSPPDAVLAKARSVEFKREDYYLN